MMRKRPEIHHIFGRSAGGAAEGEGTSEREHRALTSPSEKVVKASINRPFWQRTGLARSFLVKTALFDLLLTGATAIQMMLLAQIIAAVFLAGAHLEAVMIRVWLLVGVICLRAVIVWGREVYVQYGAIRYKNAVRQQVFAHLFRLGPMYGKGESTGELVTVLYEGIERLESYVARYLPQFGASILVPLLLVCFIVPLDWISGVLLLLTGPVIVLLMMLVGSYAGTYAERQWLALARLGATLLDAIQGVTTLKLFGQSKGASARIDQMGDTFRLKTMKMLRLAFLSGAVLEFLIAGAIGLVAVLLGVRLINHEITFVAAFQILLLTPEFYRPLRELGVQHHAGMEGRAAARRIDEILAQPLPIAPLSSSAVGAPARSLTITLSDLSYTYPDSGHPALKGVNLELLPGTCTALVGRSGAGKSTLAHLLLGFLTAPEGAIRANGIAVTDLPIELWREMIALVPQRPFLFTGSVLDNLRLARPQASEGEVAQAAELAGASDFIEQLPQGYATPLGEHGARLSAGQAQRLAIARAFLKDAPLLILDEPTSSLDPESETLVRQALARLVQQRTVLVIAHRYNTLASAHQVALLHEGELVEVGNRALLLRYPELFPRLVQPLACQEEMR